MSVLFMYSWYNAYVCITKLYKAHMIYSHFKPKTSLPMNSPYLHVIEVKWTDFLFLAPQFVVYKVFLQNPILMLRGINPSLWIQKLCIHYLFLHNTYGNVWNSLDQYKLMAKRPSVSVPSRDYIWSQGMYRRWIRKKNWGKWSEIPVWPPPLGNSMVKAKNMLKDFDLRLNLVLAFFHSSLM